MLEQVLQFSLDLKNAKFNTKYKLSDYNDVLENRYLNKLLKSRTNLISGGEKQRATIASEFIADKPILNTSEPTSDLDSHWALKLICFLKNLAILKKNYHFDHTSII